MSSFVLNQDGLPVAFVIGNDRAVWYQTADKTGSWGQWISLKGQWKRFTVAANQDGRLTVFAIGMDEAVWRCSQDKPNGTFGGWGSLKGQWKQLAVAPNQDGRLTVFAIGMDEAVWRCSQDKPNGTFGGWSSLKGQWKQLAVAPNQDGRLTVFAIGMDEAVWRCSQDKPNGVIGGWSSLKGQWKQLVVNRQPNGTLQVIALGFDYETYRITQQSPNGSWGGWQKLYVGQKPGSGIAAEIRLSPTEDDSLVMFLTNEQSPVKTTKPVKSKGDLKRECTTEVLDAFINLASGSALAAAPGVASKVVAMAQITRGVMQTSSAAAKCNEAYSDEPPSNGSGDGDSSDGSSNESPDKKSVRGVEEPRYFDIVPNPSGDRVMVA
jgi:Tectonin domain